MANVFGILTAIVLALSIFVAFKNKAAYEDRIVETATQKDNLAKSQARFKAAQDSLDDTLATQAEEEGIIDELTKESTTVRDSNSNLTVQIETKTATANSNKQKLDEVRERTERIGDLRDLADKMRNLSSEREELSQSITSNEATLANLTAQNNQTEAEANALRLKLDTLTSGQSLPTLNTRIRSIYPTWGFVTLAAGNNGGVATNSTLNVVRDGQVIARLLVTAVESTSASASIVPDSSAEDTVLMVGDQVVPSNR
jgi:hypothetical protein